VGIRDERAAATRQKLIEAAREEFQRHGFAGGRVDDVAIRAGMNKRLIYAHFESKAGLFDAVVADNVARVARDVPFTAGDLPGYAVQLFDYWMANPVAVRLFAWRNIEESHAPQFENETYRRMVEAIESAGGDRRAGLPADHLLALLFAVLLAWAIPAETFQQPIAEEQQRRRATVREAVHRITDPSRS
jgi:AcrR family transcriptional regulator